MVRIKIIFRISIVFLIFVLISSSSFNPSKTQAKIFSGSGSLTTSTYSSSPYSKITWTTDPANDFWAFISYIYELGEPIYDTLFDGANGTTYLYNSGTFYFDVLAANLNSWTIVAENTTGEYLSPQDTLSGSDDLTSKLFNSQGYTKINWSYIPANEFDAFYVYIFELGSPIFTSFFDSQNGTTFLYESGTFYFSILAANILQWTIDIDINVISTQTSTDVITDTSTAIETSTTTTTETITNTETDLITDTTTTTETITNTETDLITDTTTVTDTLIDVSTSLVTDTIIITDTETDQTTVTTTATDPSTSTNTITVTNTQSTTETSIFETLEVLTSTNIIEEKITTIVTNAKSEAGSNGQIFIMIIAFVWLKRMRKRSRNK